MKCTENIYLLLSIALLSVQTIITVLCSRRLLTFRNEKKGNRQILWFIVINCILQIIKCTEAVPVNLLVTVMPVIMVLLYVWYIIYVYKDKGSKKVLHISMLLLQNTLAEIISDVLWGLPGSGENMAGFVYNNRGIVQTILIITLISAVLNISYTMIVLKTRKKHRMKADITWLIILILFVLIGMSVHITNAPRELSDSYFLFICLFTIVGFIILLVYLSQIEKKEIKREVDELNAFIEQEKGYYQQIEERREEMARLRHDYNNVIGPAICLIENGKSDDAVDVLNDFHKRVSQTRENYFCPIPVINAVLSDKEKICKKEGIFLSIDLMFPENLTVANLDLCMIFGNIMDNAIRACKEAGDQGKKKSISLNGQRIQGYLVIKCKNTALDNPEKQIKGTGYGQKILSDLAKKYDGDFQKEYQNGIYTTKIILKIM